ncbi:MAG: class I SAM-dependent methyltransferase [Solirubrobacteraceae bacterium]
MTTAPSTRADPRRAREAIAQVKRWYHCIEVAPGVVTDGLFDLRPIVDRLPWPDVRGKRCLDVGTSDGFFAFELERRGAAEVVATDISGHQAWDWELHLRELGPEYLRHVAGPQMGVGFEVARRLLSSGVVREPLSVYDLTPVRLGQFDVVVCGSLLLHLRDPLRALAAIHSVCAGSFLSTNQVDLLRSLEHPRQPLIRLDGTSGITQWWLPNVAGHRQMLRSAGFELERESCLYSIPLGPAHAPPARTPRGRARSLTRRLLTGNDGVTHHAVLARPV